jgi:hypothetical protein
MEGVANVACAIEGSRVPSYSEDQEESDVAANGECIVETVTKK